MSPQEFVYWLNGFVELSNPEEITKEQWRMIKERLPTVDKVTSPIWVKSQTVEPFSSIKC